MHVAPTSGRISCSACGGLNPEIARFCNRCAAPLVGAATSAARQAVASPTSSFIRCPHRLQNTASSSLLVAHFGHTPALPASAARFRSSCGSVS